MPATVDENTTMVITTDTNLAKDAQGNSWSLSCDGGVPEFSIVAETNMATKDETINGVKHRVSLDTPPLFTFSTTTGVITIKPDYPKVASEVK